MTKRIGILGIVIIFVLSAFVSSVFAPLIQTFGAKASSPSAGGHYVETDISMSITSLPESQYKTSDQIVLPTVNAPDCYFTLTRVVGRGELLGVSDPDVYGQNSGPNPSFSGSVTDVRTLDKYGNPGGYVYKFYTPTQFMSTDTNGNFNGVSAYDYPITVVSDTFTISLPENSPDIFPNVTIPNPTLSNPRNPDWKPIGQSGHVDPIVPIVLPLPQSLVDTDGRDLLGLGDESTRKDAIAALKAIYGTGSITSLGGTIDSVDDGTAEHDTLLRNLVYADMRIAFYGNGNTEYSRDTETGYVQDELGIIDAVSRTFVPVNDGGNYYAVYYYQHTDSTLNVDVSASLRTQSITVQQPSTGLDKMNTIKNDILFNAKPSMSFDPGSISIGNVLNLPVPTVTISTDSDIKFDSTSTVANFTYITVLFHDDSTSDFKYIGTDGKIISDLNVTQTDVTQTDSRIMHITDFKFTPSWIGTYQFNYYTTTLFGYGKNDYSPKPVTVGNYLKYTPFDDMKIDRNTQAPVIKWTGPFTYQYQDDKLQGVTFEGETTITKYEDAEDLSQYLPGNTNNSKTVIKKGDYLYIPALLGDSNFNQSDKLDYRLELYRYENGVRDITSKIYWASGMYTGNTSYNGTVWDHTRPFQVPGETEFGIPFPNNLTFRTSDFLGSSVNPTNWLGKDVADTYDLVAYAWDTNSNRSTQFTYTFKVEDDYNASRPQFNGSFTIGQQAFNKGDTVKFNAANLTDQYTNDTNIEAKYYVSSENGTDIATGGAAEIKNDSSYKTMGISSGIVSFELSTKNPAGAYVLEKLEQSGDNNLPFRIYAVARNYQALVKDINIDDYIGTTGDNKDEKVDSSDTASTPRQLDIDNACLLSTDTNALPYIAASYISVSIYKTTYGSAANIEQIGSDGDAYSWSDYLDGQTTKQGSNITLPALKFSYADGSYVSSIEYAIIDQKTGARSGVTSFDKNNNVIGGNLTNKPIGEENSDPDLDRSVTLGQTDTVGGDAVGLDTARYFTTTKIGPQWVVVTVKNAGGNVGIFVGVVNVTGTPSYSADFVGGDTTSMKKGEKKSLPALNITIGGNKYVSGGLESDMGYIVTEKNYGTLGRQAKVGTYSITFGSDNGDPATMYGNSFAPTAEGRYLFIYTIVINNAPDNISPLEGSDTITITKNYYFTVGNIDSSDMILSLDAKRYDDIATGATPLYGTGGTVLDNTLASDPTKIDPTKTNKYNFFTDMTVAEADGKTLEMSDSQLYNGLEPYMTSGVTVPTSWQYGKIYLPNDVRTLSPSVSGLAADFYANADRYITVVYHPGSGNDVELLNTQEGSATANNYDTTGVASEGMYWFRPQGYLTPQYIKDGAAYTPTTVDEALEYAANKDKWVPATGSTKVDGEYIVTYTLSYSGVTVSKTYSIAMGDTNPPKITYIGTSSDSSTSIFDKTYQTGDSFSFVFGPDTFNITGTKNNDIFWSKTDSGKYYLQDVPNNSNVIITIYTPSNVPLYEGDDDLTISADNDKGVTTYSFKLTEAGKYRVDIKVRSESGVYGTTEYQVQVDEKTPPHQIAPEEVMGIILIIISSGLLLGVIVYFIRTGQSTKFSGKRNAPKKAKEDKPDVV